MVLKYYQNGYDCCYRQKDSPKWYGVPKDLCLDTPRGERWHIGGTWLEELAFCQENDIAHFLIKTDDGRRFTDQGPHPLREIGSQRVQFVAECIVEEFRKLGIFAFDVQLMPQVCIGNIDHRLVFPYFRTEQPAIDHLLW